MRGAPENEPRGPQFLQPRHRMSFRPWRGPSDGLCEALRAGRLDPSRKGRRGGRVVEGAQVAFGDRP
jgi:hypothetical protein